MAGAASTKATPRALRAVLATILVLTAIVPPPRAATSVYLLLRGPVRSGPPEPRPRGGGRPSPGAPLPDSTLALIESGRPGEPSREIGRARFLGAWAQSRPPSRPDSLTPAAARRFLELLVDEEALGRLAAGERWAWTPAESASFRALGDRLVLGAMLDSALAETRAALGAGADTVDGQSLGVVARDRAMARLGPVFDDSLVARLARAFAALPRPTADSSLAAQLRLLERGPRLAPADSAGVLARSAAGEYRVSDLLAAWSRLSPAYRPRIESAEQVRDLVTNGLFERALRRAAQGWDPERRPDLASQLAAQRERLAVRHLVEREVYAPIVPDSLAIARFYRATEEEWSLPTRVRLVRLVLPARSAAEAMAPRLASAAEAESLAAGARRGGAQWTFDVSAREDSALFARALRAGPGAVLGPDPVADGWAIARVLAVLPGRGRPLSEVRAQVTGRWYAGEAERRLQRLTGRARLGLRVVVNEAALEALVREAQVGPR